VKEFTKSQSSKQGKISSLSKGRKGPDAKGGMALSERFTIVIRKLKGVVCLGEVLK
jgi:hypothetical protein